MMCVRTPALLSNSNWPNTICIHSTRLTDTDSKTVQTSESILALCFVLELVATHKVLIPFNMENFTFKCYLITLCQLSHSNQPAYWIYWSCIYCIYGPWEILTYNIVFACIASMTHVDPIHRWCVRIDFVILVAIETSYFCMNCLYTDSRMGGTVYSCSAIRPDINSMIKWQTDGISMQTFHYSFHTVIRDPWWDDWWIWIFTKLASKQTK